MNNTMVEQIRVERAEMLETRAELSDLAELKGSFVEYDDVVSTQNERGMEMLDQLLSVEKTVFPAFQVVWDGGQGLRPLCPVCLSVGSIVVRDRAVRDNGQWSFVTTESVRVIG